MSYSIVYSSQTGNTKLLAETLHNALPQEGCVYFGTPNPQALAADLVYVGFWTDKGTCDAPAAEFLKGLKEQKIFLFGTAGFGGGEAYFNRILGGVKSLLDPSVTVTGTYMCQGKMPMAIRERYERMKANPDPSGRFDPDVMIANFDQALSHPDENDLKNLVSTVKSM